MGGSYGVSQKMLSSPTSFWAIEEKQFDSTTFFRGLAEFFPEATTLFVEGASIAKDVLKVLSDHKQGGEYWHNRGTIKTLFGDSNHLYRCEFSNAIVDKLEYLSQAHAAPEICDHLSLFLNEQPILEFYDFPQNEIWISDTIEEYRVKGFSSVLEANYEKQTNG